jgi:predicted RND superfamily exporter protein
LTRYQEEKEKCDDQAEAIRNAFTGVGTALIMTTIVLVAGFSTVLLSDSRDHFIFASMGIITLSAALFADLVFLPAMLARFMK